MQELVGALCDASHPVERFANESQARAVLLGELLLGIPAPPRWPSLTLERRRRDVAGMAGEDMPGVALVQRPESTAAEWGRGTAGLGRGYSCARRSSAAKHRM